MNNNTIYKITSLIMALSLLVLGGCNTMQGLGEDIEGAGEVISETAADVKEDITN